MGRALRQCPGGLIYHVLNRANGRARIFRRDPDYEAFERILAEALPRVGMRLLSYCVMPNHWHLVLWPRADGDLSRFVGWLTLTHTQRLHVHRDSAGMGHVYQGRFKSFPVQDDEHFWTVARYVERNPLRAGLVEHAGDWRWGSLWRWTHHGEEDDLISPWPVPRPTDWPDRINATPGPTEEEALQKCFLRGQPFGDPAWKAPIARKLGLESTLRQPGRPRKVETLENGS